MTPRKKLAQLQRESKPSKFGNKPVYACPFCWHKLEEDHNFYSCVNKGKCIHARKSITIDKEYIEIFDSLAEHARGYGELKPLETAGIITDLEHHKIFKLWPRLYGETWIRKETGTRIFSVSNVKDDTFDGAIELPHQYLQWESDFTYQMKGENVIEEAKELTRIDKTTSKTTAAGQKITQTVKVDFPYFTSDEDFRHFRKICQLMLAIHGHRVQVRAGGQLWMFNAKGELERIYGRIK